MEMGCMCTCECRCLRSSEEGIRDSGAAVTGSELPGVGSGDKSQASEKAACTLNC